MSLKAVSLSDQIADHLSEMIIQGTLAPGEKLHEVELAKRLDVSTNSLREALRVLEARHLVVIQPRRGARVCDITETQVVELYDFLFMLFAQLAERTAYNWQEGELDRLMQMLGMLVQAHQNQDMAGAHQMVFSFLPDFLSFGRNSYLSRTIQDLTPLLQRYSYMALVEETTEFDVTLRIFGQLLTSVQQRDGAAAAACIREYGVNQANIVLRALRQRRAASAVS